MCKARVSDGAVEQMCCCDFVMVHAQGMNEAPCPQPPVLLSRTDVILTGFLFLLFFSLRK